MTHSLRQAYTFSLLSLILFHAPLSASPLDEAPSGLLGFWPMNEASGTRLNSAVTPQLDGILMNEPSWSPGVAGTGLRFDGVDDHVSFNKLSGIPSGQNFTFSIFVKPEESGRYQQIFWEGQSRTTLGLWLTSDNCISLYSRAENELNAKSISPVATGEWSHVAVTISDLGTQREVKFFIDGQLTNTQLVSGELFQAPTRAFLGAFGRTNNEGQYFLSSFFKGELDDLRIYNRALTEAEIAMLKATNTRLDLTGPVRLNGSPSGQLPAFSSPVLLSLKTNETAECRYGLNPHTTFSQLPWPLPNRFGGTIHEMEISDLPNGQSYTAYVRCQDRVGNINDTDFPISFSLSNLQPVPEPVGGGRVFFLSLSGSDSNKGDVDSPFKTFYKAGSVLQAGDTLYVRGGIYNDFITDGINSGTGWDRPITYKAYPGERPVLRPTVRNNVVRFNSNAYIVIDGLVLDAILFADYELPVVKVTSNAHHIRIINSELMNSLNGMGLQASGPRGDHVEVINCDIHDNGQVAIGSQNHGIYLSSPHCLIENNRFYRNSTWHIHGYSGNSDNTIVRGNLFYDADGAILISNGSHWLVANNVIENGGRGTGIAIRDYVPIENTRILNNTIYECVVGISVAENSAGVTDTSVINNIIYKNRLGGLIISAGASGTLVRNNLIAKSPTSFGASILNSGMSTQLFDNFLDGNYDPMFVNPLDRNFQLQENSTAINTGMPLVDVFTDFLGTDRPQGKFFDRGAFERSEASQKGDTGQKKSANDSTDIQWQLLKPIVIPSQGKKALAILNIEGAALAIRLSVIDRKGALVTVIADRVDGPGPITLEWDGQTQSGGIAAAGVYLFKLEAGDNHIFKKVVVVK